MVLHSKVGWKDKSSTNFVVGWKIQVQPALKKVGWRNKTSTNFKVGWRNKSSTNKSINNYKVGWNNKM